MGLLLTIFPSLGPKGVINTLIAVYQRLKKMFPAASENDQLNSLIMSRVNTPLSPSTPHEEFAYYEPVLQNTNKRLEDVIWAIVEYEYILSREEKLFRELSKIDDSPIRIAVEMAKQKEEYRRYIKESIKESVDYPNMEFRKLRRDYKSFLCIFFIGIVFGILESFLIPNMPNSILIIFSILFSLGWLFYTVKVVIDTFKVFKIIKPSALQVGIAIFLFWLFFLSPLVMGSYIIYFMNRYKNKDGH